MPVIIGLADRLGYEGVWILFLTLLSLYLISQLLRMRKQNRDDKLKAIQITIKVLKDLGRARLSDDQYSRLSEVALQAVEAASLRPDRHLFAFRFRKEALGSGLAAAGLCFAFQVILFWDSLTGPLALPVRELEH